LAIPTTRVFTLFLQVGVGDCDNEWADGGLGQALEDLLVQHVPLYQPTLRFEGSFYMGGAYARDGGFAEDSEN
jgi:hypothetical protein